MVDYDLATDNKKDRNWAIFGVKVVLVLGLLFYFRPWLHPLALALYTNPHVIQSIILGGVAAGIAWYTSRRYTVTVSAFTTVTVGFLLVASALVQPYKGVTMANMVEQNAQTVTELPNISEDNPRILPRTVASEFAENSLQEPRYRLGDADIAISENGTPQWTYPLRPDGVFNTFLIKQKGAAFVDMTTSQSDVTYNDEEMMIGVGSQIRDNIKWNLRKLKYWVGYEEQFSFEHDQDLYLATPYIDYEFKFRFPIVYTVPTWGGVAVTDADGVIEYVDADQVGASDVLRGQRLYPFDLARRYVSSMEYKNGIVNKWFFHEDQLEVAPLPGFTNDQPFMILTDDNPALFIATEPYGRASGLFEIWTVDAVTGDYDVYKLNRSEGLIGANKAVNFVRKANSRVNWADRGSDTGFRPIEPIPVTIDDELYWQIRVVPVDSAGTAFTSFVNAETSTVYTAETDEDITAFLQGEELDTAGNTTTQTTGPTGDKMAITIIEEGDVVDTVTVNASAFDINVERVTG